MDMQVERVEKAGSKQMGIPQDLYGRPHCETRKHTFGSYVWLAYSAFFFIEPVMRNTRTYWLHQLPLYAVFLALFIAYVDVTRKIPRLLIVGGILLLGVADIPFNVGASSFFIYVAALLPFCVESTPILVSTMVGETVILLIESRFYPGNPVNYLITGLFVVVVGASNLFVAQGKRADARLRQAQEENVQLAAVAERERIARDLHDVLGHTLSVIVLKAELAGRLMDRDPVRAAAEIADVERTARTALAEVREAIGGYRSKGLNAEVEQARLTLDAAGVALNCETRPPTLGAQGETVLSLAVREAVTNIVRHARATECTMRFATAPDGFASFEVADNGGDASQEVGGRPLREGNGLRGMRERVQGIGGRFRIESAEGMRLVIEVPRAELSVAGEG